ncbi:hypothetical protein EV2_012333 [Malus domestica]
MVLVKEYISKVESKLSDVCTSILKLLESNLVPSASATESKVFFLYAQDHRLSKLQVADDTTPIVGRGRRDDGGGVRKMKNSSTTSQHMAMAARAQFLNLQAYRDVERVID